MWHLIVVAGRFVGDVMGTEALFAFRRWREGKHVQAEVGPVALWVGFKTDRLMVGAVFNVEALTFGVGVGPLYAGIGAVYDRSPNVEMTDPAANAPWTTVAPLADNGFPRCSSLGEHHDRLMFYGWCGCGFAGCPRSPKEWRGDK